MYLLANLLIKLSMLTPLGWRAAPVKNHWYIYYIISKRSRNFLCRLL